MWRKNRSPFEVCGLQQYDPSFTLKEKSKLQFSSLSDWWVFVDTSVLPRQTTHNCCNLLGTKGIIFYPFFYHSQFLVNSAIAPFSVQARLSTNKHSAVAFGYFCSQRCTVRILGDCTGVHLSPFCPTVWSVRRQRHMLDHKFCLKKHSSPDRLDEPNNPHLSTTYQHNTLVFSQLLLNAQ